MNKDDELLFADEAEDAQAQVNVKGEQAWKVLIVDDEQEVHNVTKLALRRFVFDGRPVEFISAFSAAEGRNLLEEHDDTAVVLLDVVMEDEGAGLRLAKYIREELGNRLVRIILRTGQPGQAPEYEVITAYDINDYKEKTELTTQKLYTTLVAALRSYRDLRIIDMNRKGLQKIVDSAGSIFELQSMQKFASGVLSQLVALLRLNPNALYCHASAFAATCPASGETTLQILAATGEFEALIGAKHRADAKALPGYPIISRAIEEQRSVFDKDCFVIFFRSKRGSENLIYLDGLRELAEWDRHLLEVFCTNVSIAFENIYLNEEVEDTQKEILFTLGEVAEARSQETGNHVRRVAEVTKLLALKAGLPEDEAEMIRMATPIHDLGKLAIPDAILNKPGKLSEEEFAIMKKHAEYGYEMLRHSHRPILKNGAVIALQHHERYDGKGYPNGLKGEEIHFYGRLVALADVFDALSTQRVYKKAWPMEEVVEYIREQRGAQFDPQIVDLFLEHVDEILRIRERYPED
ncbi:DUF3369 domain-containing protein [Azotosporobacter soli]|uniref:DUF3369 domain-containing protein n=1 Tax=Azotosporobacter soli TaxID=3055040 RepID=UPI0031FE828A